MAIGALLGEPHSFMHDLESFFWVLFWICIHHNGSDQKRTVVKEFEKWNYKPVNELADIKIGKTSLDVKFDKEVADNFTAYCQPLIPCVQQLHKVVFPDGKPWKTEDKGLFGRMKAVLEKAREDPEVITAV